MTNYKLVLCYDGTRYKGWQKQGNTDNTIQQKVETLLSRVLEQPIEVSGCGRTDAGVHAKMQVCNFRAETEKSAFELLKDVRRYLPEDIGAVSLEAADMRFHARLSCKKKTYRYRIWRSEEPNVFERNYVYAFFDALDADKMRRAVALLCGKHDYTAFTSNKHMKKSAERTLESITITEQNGEMDLTFTGDGFLYNMVRILVGTLIEVGQGKRDPRSMKDLIDSKDRSAAGFTAPAQGLCLETVEY